MRYRESIIDTKLRSWFHNDYGHSLLHSIELEEGKIRGLAPFNLQFKFPITAIAGRNGSGKSTLLALSACAFHNHKNGFALPERKSTYYTFSDFFIQFKDEIPPQGVRVWYKIAHNNWKKSKRVPDGVGLGLQLRSKKQGGKWNDYAKRVHRDVVFLGVSRIVPHSEKSQSKSYSKYFKTVKKGHEDKIKDIVGYILNKTYDDFSFAFHSKYKLPVVKTENEEVYSGFNMGAGENALFEIFSVIYTAKKGLLLIIDEIELGLHVEAQKRLINKLKEVCLEQHVQVICTTHSSTIFDCLPPDGRIYLENATTTTRLLTEISSKYAFSKLSSEACHELSILVEDEVARKLLLNQLPYHLRVRSKIEVIGSASALVRQLAALYSRGSEDNTLVVFDGDQRQHEADNKALFKSQAETVEDGWEEWFFNRIAYLPGEGWPEKWMLQKCKLVPDQLKSIFSCDQSIITIIDAGLIAGKHNEFHELARRLGLDKEGIVDRCAMIIKTRFSDEFSELLTRIAGELHCDVETEQVVSSGAVELIQTQLGG